MKIEIKKIGKKYEGNKAYTLNDINLDIADKDFTVLLGPSGCGKTTLLRMIAGLNSITKGDLLFNGRRVNELAPKDRDIAMVFQSYALYPHMNVFNNIAFGLKLKHEKKSIIEKRVRDVAKVMNLYDYLYNKPSDLSGGQRQRVALGRAIAKKPKIFLMDEPLSNLDAKLREKMRVEIVEIHEMLGTTTIYVTHDQLEAMTMATKIVLMNNQRIIQVAHPKEIYNEPNCIFAAKFIGSPTMNFVEGTYSKGVFNSGKDDFKFEVGTTYKKQLDKQWEGKKVVFGIRPSNISLSPKKTGMKNPIEILTESTELLGNDQIVRVKTSGMVLRVLVPNWVEIKSKMYIDFDLRTAHFFDKDTEQRVCENYEELAEAWKKHEEFLKSSITETKMKKQLFKKMKLREKKLKKLEERIENSSK
ncbi:ABC transporter ATP-binding protein [Mycoplasma todarodis]|uniref:ABC transporter ATP-binding protein n=1 Tax=Mycoplasma todarodis TaxID=1937191 RepID=A0A4R0XS03_9MOLU|nr:ABC transporter ATP-binding protein [Mycoplasma todarodis]TCG11655.1 ABC transporter ATP-binding protein [Mycoplasma todarodis]